jgi:hypothetical protein
VPKTLALEFATLKRGAISLFLCTAHILAEFNEYTPSYKLWELFNLQVKEECFLKYQILGLSM